MKNALSIIGIILLVLAVFVAGFVTLRPKPPKPPESVETLAELEAYLENLAGHNAGSPPGLSLVVVQDGQVVYRNAFGMADGPNAIPATPDTVYNQWSMTKIFTAVAILQLQEQGLLNIEDQVSRYLDFFEM